MDIRGLKYFKEKYEIRKPMFMSQEQHWSWLYHVLYYFASILLKKDIDAAIVRADEAEQISLVEH